MVLSLDSSLFVGNDKNVFDEGDTLPVILERTLVCCPDTVMLIGFQCCESRDPQVVI